MEIILGIGVFFSIIGAFMAGWNSRNIWGVIGGVLMVWGVAILVSLSK